MSSSVKEVYAVDTDVEYKSTAQTLQALPRHIIKPRNANSTVTQIQDYPIIVHRAIIPLQTLLLPLRYQKLGIIIVQHIISTAQTRKQATDNQCRQFVPKRSIEPCRLLQTNVIKCRQQQLNIMVGNILTEKKIVSKQAFSCFTQLL